MLEGLGGWGSHSGLVFPWVFTSWLLVGGIPLVRQHVGVTLANENVVLEMKWWELKRGRHTGISTRGGENFERKSQARKSLFASPLTHPCLTVWLFLVSPLASFFLCPVGGTTLWNLFSPPSLPSVLFFPTSHPPSASFNGPSSRSPEGSTTACHIHGCGWCSRRYLWWLGVSFTISLYYPTSLGRPPVFPFRQNEPLHSSLSVFQLRGQPPGPWDPRPRSCHVLDVVVEIP